MKSARPTTIPWREPIAAGSVRSVPLLGLWLVLAGCPEGGGAEGTDTDGSTGTIGTASAGPSSVDASADASAGTSADDVPCVPGELGCSCGPGGACDGGLVCERDVCVSEIPVCGNGVPEGDEQCDLGNDLDDEGECKTDCTLASCGDGFVGPGEVCDDGNLIHHDQCSNACQLPACGDGVLQDGETCDDGNMSDADACTSVCDEAECGDSIVWEGREQCDDGNGSNTDDCTNACVSATCGDGFLWAGQEECDGANLGGATCVTQGFVSGSLSCTGMCTFDTTGCM